jgi:hypothetical protein
LPIEVEIKISRNDEIKDIALVATFKVPVATCGEWRQGWTPLIYTIHDTFVTFRHFNF